MEKKHELDKSYNGQHMNHRKSKIMSCFHLSQMSTRSEGTLKGSKNTETESRGEPSWLLACKAQNRKGCSKKPKEELQQTEHQIEESARRISLVIGLVANPLLKVDGWRNSHGELHRGRRPKDRRNRFLRFT